MLHLRPTRGLRPGGVDHGNRLRASTSQRRPHKTESLRYTPCTVVGAGNKMDMGINQRMITTHSEFRPTE